VNKKEKAKIRKISRFTLTRLMSDFAVTSSNKQLETSAPVGKALRMNLGDISRQ
jgi:hypothetical protein